MYERVFIPPVQMDELLSASHCKSMEVKAAAADLSVVDNFGDTDSTTAQHHL